MLHNHPLRIMQVNRVLPRYCDPSWFLSTRRPYGSFCTESQADPISVESTLEESPCSGIYKVEAEPHAQSHEYVIIFDLGGNGKTAAVG
jgi:hypothetical protein